MILTFHSFTARTLALLAMKFYKYCSLFILVLSFRFCTKDTGRPEFYTIRPQSRSGFKKAVF
jgi:hypothetical protein